MIYCVKPSPGKFKSRSASVASSALIDGKTNEIFCVSLPSPNLSSTRKLFIYDVYLSWQFLPSVIQPFGFPQLKDFPLCHTMQTGWTTKKVKVANKCIFNLENISHPKVMKWCLLTCHSHKSKWNLHASLKTCILCATLDFHGLIWSNLWRIVNMMTCDSFCSRHLEANVAATTIYSSKQTPTPVYDGCLEIRGAENKLFCIVEVRQHWYNLNLFYVSRASASFFHELHLYPTELGLQGSFTGRSDCQRRATSSYRKAGPVEMT